ncbi:YgfZ/GcvT domain-containing protein [Chromohalobacter nigrandesensis]|uniref:CAF17-like 4Fe-4S cluster assembly/insertion protein YgfZ n=1 Tax=Chromohalobacter nigrandesensis TaxID=119863 RepID=UPI001FF25183|nr:folate-binding protein [Chromohalobacter nigrandesensis]MCK0745076.1 folate-binding protein [Chromohalobacter nigrandesensis]
MNDWSRHLEAQGLVRTAENEWHFGEAVSEARVPLSSTAIAPLPQYSIMEIAGPDAERFLQGQTSAQVTLVDGEFAPLTAFCSPKGRMLANGQLMRVDETRYWLVLDSGVAEPLHAHLAKYAPFYKVEITQPATRIFGVFGEDATAQVEAQLHVTAPATWAMAQNDAAVILRHPGPIHRFMIVVPEDTALSAWKAFEGIATPVGNAVWRLQDIQAGLAWLGETQRDSYLPQMINWEALGGISFRKGCYTGQEVVARAHFRGQVKKRLLRTQSENATLPAPGTPVHDANGKSQGDVVCAALNADGKAEVLAIITQRDEPRELNIDGVPLERLALPYAIERVDPESMSLSA